MICGRVAKLKSLDLSGNEEAKARQGTHPLESGLKMAETLHIAGPISDEEALSSPVFIDVRMNPARIGTMDLRDMT